MTEILPLEKKAALIHDCKNKMDKLWNVYTMDLLKSITATERLYHHQIVPHQRGHLMINFFGKIGLDITRSESFGKIRLDYRLTSEAFSDIAIAPAHIDSEGMLDASVPLACREDVFSHYLKKIEPIYDRMLTLSLRDARA